MTPSAKGGRQRPRGSRSLQQVKRVLVATDGSPSADGALRVAAALRERGSDVRVLTVLSPLMPYVSEFGSLAFVSAFEPAEAARRDLLRRTAREQMQRVIGEELPLTLVTGWPPETIARSAISWRSQLILMGLGRHRPVDRLLGSETAVRVVRVSKVAVLAVPVHASALPRSIVAGVDLSRSSVTAVERALRIAAPDAVVHLVHVGPALARLVELESPDWMELYDTGVQQRLEALAGQLRERHPKLDVRAVRLSGRPAEELLGYGAKVNADLIVVGAQRHSLADRLLLGTVSAQLLRGAHCAVFVAPVVSRRPATLARRRPGARKRTSK